MKCECGYSTSLKYNFTRHQSKCVANQLALKNAELCSEIAFLKDKIGELTAENAELRRSSTTINVTNNNNINIVAYGQEPVPELQDVLKILRPPERSVARYIELKHFAHPETSNLRIKNKRSRTMQVVEKDASKRLRWTEKDKKRMIEKLVEENLEELTETHGAEQVLLWKQWYRSNGLANDGYDKTEAWKRMNNDVEDMLISQRENNVLS
jgi:hypothetical protein